MSTDPAHSLGDALGINLVAGELTPIPGVPMMPDGDGCLYALEVDVTEAVEELLEILLLLWTGTNGGMYRPRPCRGGGCAL